MTSTRSPHRLPANAQQFAGQMPGAQQSATVQAAPATYAGYQEGFGRIPGIELYNLTRAIPGHCAGSTVSRQTLEAAGYVVASPRDREARRAAWYRRNHAA